MADLVFQVPARTTFGLDAVNRVGVVTAPHASRAVLVTETVPNGAESLQRVQDLLSKKGIDCIIFDELLSGATDRTACEVLSLARASQAHAIIGMGGMNVLTIARCAAAALDQGIEIAELFETGTPTRQRTHRRAHPSAYIEIPTAVRNHFMFRDFCVLTDSRSNRARMARTGPGVLKAVLLDPRLSMTLSHKSTAAALLDVLLAAVEGYLSTRSNFLSDTFMQQSVRTLVDAFRATVTDSSDIRVRTLAYESAFLCALGVSASSQGPGAALTYAISAQCGVPKAWIAAVLLPHILEFQLSARPERIGELAVALGEDVDAMSAADDAARAPAAVRQMLGRLKLSTRLRELDLKLDDMVEAAEAASEFEMVRYSPVPLSSQELYDLVKLAF